MDTAILARVEDFCIREGLLQPGASLRLAAAVSGGADSMALLLLLRQLQPRFGYTLSACHVNHGLRGQSADRDEAFVRVECARLGVPLRVFHAAELVSPPVHAGEDWARRLRYTAFAQLQGQGIDAIATAHTANDQAETLLLRLARGTGLHGAGGIRPRRGCYLRPLLCLSRAETETVCRAAGQPWVTDETNDTDAYARNRLRHSALPALESTNAAAVQNLARFCEKAARVDAYLAAGAAKLLAAARLPGAEPAWQLTPLQAADPLLLETALHSLVAPVRDAEEKYVQLLCAVVRQGSGAVQLTGQVRFCAGNSCLRQETLPQAEQDLFLEFLLALTGNELLALFLHLFLFGLQGQGQLLFDDGRRDAPGIETQGKGEVIALLRRGRPPFGVQHILEAYPAIGLHLGQVVNVPEGELTQLFGDLRQKLRRDGVDDPEAGKADAGAVDTAHGDFSKI